MTWDAGWCSPLPHSPKLRYAKCEGAFKYAAIVAHATYLHDVGVAGDSRAEERREGMVRPRGIHTRVRSLCVFTPRAHKQQSARFRDCSAYVTYLHDVGVSGDCGAEEGREGPIHEDARQSRLERHILHLRGLAHRVHAHAIYGPVRNEDGGLVAVLDAVEHAGEVGSKVRRLLKDRVACEGWLRDAHEKGNACGDG